jgi:hypothetical protein
VVVAAATADKTACKIYVNGIDLPGTAQAWYTHYDPKSSKDWTRHDSGKRNAWRFGAPSRADSTLVGSYPINWSADATFDELFLWTGNGLNLPSTTTTATLAGWYRGRYAAPQLAAEGIFTSRPITAFTDSVRVLPPVSSSGTTKGPATTGSTTTALPAPPCRILGMSWTWFAEGVEPATGRPCLIDYKSAGYATRRIPTCEVALIVNGQTLGPYNNDEYSAVDAGGGSGVPVPDGTPFRYRVSLKVPGAPADAILLMSPVFDDITIYFSRGDTDVLSWTVKQMS